MNDGKPIDWVQALQGEAVRFIADAIPGPVSYLDRELRYRFVNAAYADFLIRVKSPFTPQTILGKTSVEAYGEEIGGSLLPNLRRALAGETFTVEVGLPVSRTLNSYIPHQVDGEVVGILLVAQDITALHASKNAVVQAERMATLGRLMGGLLHEVNTPAGVLRSSLQTLETTLGRMRESPESPERTARKLQQLQRVAATALEANERVIAMVARLRNFARVDEKAVQRVDLHEGLDSAVFLLQPQLDAGIEVITRYGELPPVECEPASINQIYMALLSNAIRAVEGQGTITIRTWADAEHGHVAIEDDGVGIARERLPTLFSPSFSAAPDRVKAGVGLYVAHNIAEQHRGTLRVESEPGVGSTFTLSLPLTAPG